MSQMLAIKQVVIRGELQIVSRRVDLWMGAAVAVAVKILVFSSCSGLRKPLLGGRRTPFSAVLPLRDCFGFSTSNTNRGGGSNVVVVVGTVDSDWGGGVGGGSSIYLPYHGGGSGDGRSTAAAVFVVSDNDGIVVSAATTRGSTMHHGSRG